MSENAQHRQLVQILAFTMRDRGLTVTHVADSSGRPAPPLLAGYIPDVIGRRRTGPG